MNLRLVTLSVLVLFLAGCVGDAPDAKPKRPNFILLYADDQGWPGLSVQMDERRADSKSDFYQTPNLERLAERGVVFTRAYSGSSICSASRASVQTGLTTSRHGLTSIVDSNPQEDDSYLLRRTPNKNIDISGFTTLPEALKEVDPSYRTAHFGKWHLESGGPSNNGFDVGDGPTINTEGDVGDPDPKLTFSITKSGIDFMRESVESDEPFFLQLSYYAVHLEMHALDATHEKYKELPAGAKHTNPLYAAMTEDLDTGVGRVLAAVDELGLSDNTYVVYAVDNGAYVNFNEFRVKGEISSCEPLNKGKFWLYEGGIRGPMIVAGPGVARGVHSRQVISQTDLYPSFIELAGGEPPAEIDGVTFTRLLSEPKGPALTRPGDALFFHYPHYNRQTTPQSSIIDGHMKLIKFWEDGALRLYDLDADLEEQIDLAESRPADASALERRLDSYLAQADVLYPQPK